MNIKHDGDLLFLESNIGMNEKGCEILAKLLLLPEKERKELSFILKSRAALINKTNGNIYSVNY